MEKLLEILNSVHSDINYEKEEQLIDKGILDSFDIISIIAEVNDAYDISIGAEDISPENFNSAKALLSLIEKYQNA